MDFELTEQQRMIQETARDFARGEIAPHAAEWDRESRFPTEAVRKAGDLGFLGMLVPEEYGGTALGNLELVLVLEEINTACASTGATVSVQNSLITSPIINFGTDEQKERYLPRLATGELLGAYCLTEPDAGSDAASLSVSARPEGDEFVLGGTKIFVTTGESAGVYIVFARTDPETSRAKGISCFIVDRESPGLALGTKEKKLGIRASETMEIIFEDCRVPAVNLLGTRDEGFKIAMHTLDGGRIGIAAQALGIARASLEAAVAYAKERVQFDKPIAKFQAIQWKLADMAVGLDAARLLTYRAARMRDDKVPHVKEAAMAKLLASELANKAADDAVQIYGAVGYTKEFPVERYFRDAKITEIYEGTSEIQRLVIARSLLRD